MDTTDAILTRRSIRKYTDEAVSGEAVEALLRAAMAAPSAGNQQPWHFIVIDEGSLLEQVPSFHPYAAMLKDAPVAILVCGEVCKEKHAGFWVQDCSAATQNLLLAAHANGLGAVWLGIYPDEERYAGLQKLLGIPEGVIPFSLVAIGHPAEAKPPGERYDASRVRRNRW